MGLSDEELAYFTALRRVLLGEETYRAIYGDGSPTPDNRHAVIAQDDDETLS